MKLRARFKEIDHLDDQYKCCAVTLAWHKSHAGMEVILEPIPHSLGKGSGTCISCGREQNDQPIMWGTGAEKPGVVNLNHVDIDEAPYERGDPI